MKLTNSKIVFATKEAKKNWKGEKEPKKTVCPACEIKKAEGTILVNETDCKVN
jgi:hypothetical protein